MSTSEIERRDPRWPAVLAAFSAVALHFALPPVLRVGPPWTLAGIVAVLVVATTTTRYFGMHRANNWLGYSTLVVLTAGLIWGVSRLVLGLVQHRAQATEVLSAGAVLWATNVIVFASWYWRLDAGGPNARERRDAHTTGALLFPQMTFRPTNRAHAPIAETEAWRPHFVDYLFVAFNTSTAFSPTDVPVLSKWAKGAMMVQAIISFSTVVLIVARAVNYL